MFATYRSMLLTRNTRLILSASLMNSFGTGLFSAVVVLHGISLTGSPVAVTTGLSVGAVSAILLTPLSAHTVTRHGARRVAVVLSLLRAANCFLLAISPGPLFPVLLAVHVALERFAYPGSQGVLNYIARGSLRSATLSFRQLVNTLGLALGAWTATGVLFVFHEASPHYLIAFNGLSFIINASMYRAIQMPRRTKQDLKSPGTKPKLPVGLTVVSIALAVLMSSGSVVSYGLPLIASGKFANLQEVVPLVISLDVSIGALMYAFITPYIQSIRTAKGAFLAGAFLCALSVYAFGSAVSAGSLEVAVVVFAAVALAVSISLSSFAAYFLFSVPGDSRHEPRYMAAFGLSGTMTRLVYPAFVALVVTSEGSLVLILALSVALAALVAWSGMIRIADHTL